MNTVKQAIIPQIGETIKSSHLYSLAEAFNTRILSAAGDAHWRIPYYIYSTYFRKPRLNDALSYTPDSEFFDFYQFVNPSTNDVWPVEQPQFAEGANLQTNFLNRFIFGMNYERKEDDPTSLEGAITYTFPYIEFWKHFYPPFAVPNVANNPGGYYVYEREDVRVKKAQDLMKQNASSFRGYIFPYFNDIGAEIATNSSYTAFGLASEINSPGYISGKPTNPAGNSFGGYYGSKPTVESGDGCGYDTDGTAFPSSRIELIELDGLKSEKTSSVVKRLCQEGIGTDKAPNEYSEIFNSINNYIVKTTTTSNGKINGKIYAKNKFHLNQYQSGVYFGRESKNHIHRLLYNYITYAKTFDFDWFFRNQYAYAPEIGYLNSINFTFNAKSTDADIGNPTKIEFQILPSRPSFYFSMSNILTSGLFVPDVDVNYIKIYFNNANFHSYAVGDRVHLVFTNDQGIFVNGLPEEGDYVISSVNININNNYFTVPKKNNYSLSGSGFKVEIKPYLKIDGNDVNFKQETIKQSINANLYFSNSQNPATVLFSNDKTNTIDYLKLAGYLDQNYSKETLLGSLHTGVDKFTVSVNNVDNDFYYGLEVPLFYIFHSFELTATNLKTFTIRLHLFINNSENAYRDFNYDFSEVNGVYTVIPDANIVTLTKSEQFSFKFSIEKYEKKNNNDPINLTIKPVFLMYYKPKIEDAYAMLRAATYSGMDDAKIDESNHPLKTSVNLSNDLKIYGYIRSGYIPEYLESHSPSEVSLNTNALFETARRLSLFTRIVNGANNFAGFATEAEIKSFNNQSSDKKVGKVLRFDRYARQSGNVAMINQGGKKPKYNGNTSLSRIYNPILTVDLNTSSTDIENLGLMTLTVLKDKIKVIDTTSDIVKVCEAYSGYAFYDFTLTNGKFISDFNNDLAKALGDLVPIISKNDLVFANTGFNVNYDFLITSLKNDIADYEYYQFENLQGQSQGLVKKFTAENSQIGIGYEEIALAVDQDSNLFISSISIDPEFLKNKYIYIFKRVQNPSCLKTKAISLNDFFYIDKIYNLVLKVYSNISVCNYLGNFPINVSLTTNTLQEKTNEIISNNIFPRDENNNFLPLSNFFTKIVEADVSKIYTFTLSNLKDLANLLYLNYSKDRIYSTSDGTLEYNENGSFQAFTSLDFNAYNTFLSSYLINVSYLSDLFSDTKALLDDSELLKSQTVTLTLNAGANSKTEVYSFGQDIPLPRFYDNSNTITLEISVNNYKKKYNAENYNQDDGLPKNSIFSNPPIYLYIKNFIYKTGDFDNLPINRDGNLFLTRTVEKIDTSEDLPETRDIFQGIAPDYNGVATGSLLIGEEYKVYNGSISHDGATITQNTVFKAVNTQFSTVSGSPIVKKLNGIISVAPPESFTNEWILWMNFLPYSPFETSIWKEEVYGATNSPFIDRCHINSLNLPKSIENNYINTSQPRAYVPEAPPSYRYMPLTTSDPYLRFENVIPSNQFYNPAQQFYNQNRDTNEIIQKFQTACPAFNPPYKIVSAYISESPLLKDYVYIELDRHVDGYFTPAVDFRTDSNGLNDWINKKASFKYGDCALTHQLGLSQVNSIYGNGYLGSYYPRFFFVKLIPKPKSDGNSDENETDSPLYHDHLKQAELYLEAMREGFTATSTEPRNSACNIVGGYLTPPDYKYDQLLVNSTSTFYYYGNKWPSLNTFSYYFNQTGNSLPIRNFDNPRGYGPIPNLGSYAEQYVSIAKSINNLVNFRVPYPIDFYVTQETRNDNYQLAAKDWIVNDPFIRQGGAGGPFWYQGLNQNNYSSQTLRNTYSYYLRKPDGSLGAISSSQAFYVNDNTPADDWASVKLSNGSFDLNYVKNTLSIPLMDSFLPTFGYRHISNLLESPFTNIPISIQSVRTISKLEQTSYDASDPCGNYYLRNGDYFKLNSIQEVNTFCTNSTILELNPDPLLIGTPFFRVKNPVGTDKCQEWQGASFVSSSTKTLNVFEPGFRILTLNIETFKDENIN